MTESLPANFTSSKSRARTTERTVPRDAFPSSHPAFDPLLCVRVCVCDSMTPLLRLDIQPYGSRPSDAASSPHFLSATPLSFIVCLCPFRTNTRPERDRTHATAVATRPLVQRHSFSSRSRFRPVFQPSSTRSRGVVCLFLSALLQESLLSTSCARLGRDQDTRAGPPPRNRFGVRGTGIDCESEIKKRARDGSLIAEFQFRSPFFLFGCAIFSLACEA